MDWQLKMIFSHTYVWETTTVTLTVSYLFSYTYFPTLILFSTTTFDNKIAYILESCSFFLLWKTTSTSKLVRGRKTSYDLCRETIRFITSIVTALVRKCSCFYGQMLFCNPARCCAYVLKFIHSMLFPEGKIRAPSVGLKVWVAQKRSCVGVSIGWYLFHILIKDL